MEYGQIMDDSIFNSPNPSGPHGKGSGRGTHLNDRKERQFQIQLNSNVRQTKIPDHLKHLYSPPGSPRGEIKQSDDNQYVYQSVGASPNQFHAEQLRKAKESRVKKCMKCDGDTCSISSECPADSTRVYSTEFKTSPSRELIYQSFIRYLGDLELQKYRNHVDPITGIVYGVYAAKINAQTNVHFRYVFVIVQNDTVPVGYKTSLQNLRWESIQTMTIKDNKQMFMMKSQEFKRQVDQISQSEIHMIEDKSAKIVYKSHDYPLKIELIPDKSFSYSYPPTAQIRSAIESFKTIITLTDTVM